MAMKNRTRSAVVACSGQLEVLLIAFGTYFLFVSSMAGYRSHWVSRQVNGTFSLE
jgi:hypothetical protein